MARLLSIALLLLVSLIVVALIDCLSADPKAVRSLPRGAWIFLILLISPIGAPAWFLAGQPAPAVRSRHGRVLRPAGADHRRPARPIGPDDDPAFIAGLAASLRDPDLRDPDHRDSDLRDSDLRDSDLRDSDLRDSE